MKINLNKKESISRRQLLFFFRLGLLIPFFGFQNYNGKSTTKNEEKYQTLLKSDGTIVKVKVSTIKKAKILKKNISTKSFFSWLGRKL